MWKMLLVRPRLVRNFPKWICTTFSLSQNNKPAESDLFQYLVMKIKAVGPMTVAEYMQEVLTNPFGGYYTNKTVFGASGDFVTSPEVSQMFGEMITIWFINEWTKLGRPTPLNLVELGPGRGTLAADLLRVLCRFVSPADVSLRLVEVSPHLSRIQEQTLCGIENNWLAEAQDPDQSYRRAVTREGVPVAWYLDPADVPASFSFYLANEFFDALPVHKLRKTPRGWREVLVDVDPTANDQRLRFVLSPGETPAARLFSPDDGREEVEISPRAGVVMEALAVRMEEEGGLALIIDYGHEGTESDTLRAFRRHMQLHPLQEPGNADLTADVDFSYLKRVAGERVVTYGPVSQELFLKRMGIELRLQALCQGAEAQSRENLKKDYQKLTDPQGMGGCFKFLAVFPAVLRPLLERFPPAAFHLPP